MPQKLLLLTAGLLVFGAISCSNGDDDNNNEPKITDSGVISITAPTTAGAVTLVADSNPATKLYEGTSVQEALEVLMNDTYKASTDSFTISVASGTYNEMLFYTGSATINIVGTGTAQYGTDVLIKYSNSGNSDAMKELANAHGVTSGYFRGSNRFDGKVNLVLKNITLQNSYSRSANDGSSTQAEALVFSSTGNLIAYNSTFLSHQDTLYLGQKGGRMWFYKDYISGDVDFIWGYMDVALFEECSIYCRGDEATKSYIFASRSMDTDAVNKGIVVYNCNVEVADGVTMWYGRNSGSDTTAAFLNNTITGKGSLNANLYQSAPLSYVEDVAGDLALGYKDYNNTMNGTLVDTSSRLARTGALSERVAKREYNGRYAILNRGYSTTNEAYVTGTKWDISAYEEEFGATEDTSNTNIYVDPVYAKNVVGGNTVQLTPSSDAEGLTYNYASSDTSLATVDANGLVTTVAGADGTVVITVTASNGSTDTMSVKVIPVEIPATAVKVALADTSVAKYGVTTATVTFEPADTSDQTFTLTSADSNVLLYDTANSKLASSTTVEASDGTATVSVWVGGDVTNATLTAKSTVYESATAGTATVSTTAGAVTWGDTCAWRMGTDIQGSGSPKVGTYGIYDGLVIDSEASDNDLISTIGKMSLKTNSKMQTRNVTLYIPVEGASTVTINMASAFASTDDAYFSVGSESSSSFTANDDNTVYTYTYDGSTTGIVLGSAITPTGNLQKQAGDGISTNGKYLKVNVVGGDRYIKTIDVVKTGEFTATWDETTQTGASGTYAFGDSTYITDSTTGAYASSDGFVTGTGLTADGKGHGYAVAADSTVTIHVAGITQIDVLGCQYGNGAAFTAAVGDTTLATVSSCNASTDGGVGATFYYTSDEEADIVITFSGAGWVHGIKVTALDSFTFVSSISISGESEVTEGKTITLTASVSPEEAVVTAVSWSSSNDDYATVDSDGVVTGVSAGNVTITATATDGSGVTATKEITVNAQTVDISIAYATNSYTLDLNGSASGTNELTVSGDNASDASVSYESSDSTVATVNASTGEVTAVAIGIATITATESATAKTATYSLIVKDTTAENSYSVAFTTLSSVTSSGTYDFGKFSTSSAKFHSANYGWIWGANGTLSVSVTGSAVITLYNSYSASGCSISVASSDTTGTLSASTLTASSGDHKSSPEELSVTYTAGDSGAATITFTMGSGNQYFSKVAVTDASYSSTVSADALFDFRTMFASLPTTGSAASGSIKADGGEIAYSAMYYKDTTHGAYMYKTSTISFTVSGACTIYLGKDSFNGATYTIAAVDAESADLSSSLSATTVDAGIQNTDSAATLAGDATDLTADGAAAVSFNYTGTKAATITLSVTGAATTNYLPAMQVVFGE